MFCLFPFFFVVHGMSWIPPPPPARPPPPGPFAFFFSLSFVHNANPPHQRQPPPCPPLYSSSVYFFDQLGVGLRFLVPPFFFFLFITYLETSPRTHATTFVLTQLAPGAVVSVCTACAQHRLFRPPPNPPPHHVSPPQDPPTSTTPKPDWSLSAALTFLGCSRGRPSCGKGDYTLGSRLCPCFWTDTSPRRVVAGLFVCVPSCAVETSFDPYDFFEPPIRTAVVFKTAAFFQNRVSCA